MRKKRYILSVIFLCALLSNAAAQWDIPVTQFWYAKSSYNPSFAGHREEVDVNALYKQYWTKAAEAPRTLVINGSMPVEFLGLRHGVGVSLINTNMGNVSNTFIAAKYAYKHRVGRGWLNFGAQLGLHQLNFDEGSYKIQIDSTQGVQKKIVANPVDKKRVDFNVGMSWNTESFFVGVAAMHLNEPQYYSIPIDNDADSTYSKIPISYNLMLGYNIKLFSTLFEIEPMVFAQHTSQQTRLHGAMQIKWAKKISAGAMWRGDEGYSIFAGADISGVGIGYAYDYNRRMDAGPNHEIVLRYNFPLDLFKPKPQPHKSIRLL